MQKPALYFAHANGFPAGCYRIFLDRLATRCTVRSVGTLGLDPRFPVRDGWAELGSQVTEAIREGGDGPAFVVGHSVGGVASFIAAYTKPELVRGLVMLDPPVINGPKGFLYAAAKLVGRSEGMTPAAQSQKRRERWPSVDEVRTQLGGKRLFRSLDPACFEDFLASALVPDEGPEGGVRLRIPVATEVAIFRTVPHDLYRYWRRLKVPAALLTAEDSEISKAGGAARLARRHGVPNTVVPGGHLFPLERPIEAADEVLGALERIGAFVE